jgi:hypothetical protein
MAISSQGTTFTFPGFTAHFTSISVEEPEAEVVDMTKIDDPLGRRRMVATTDVLSPARVTVDYIRLANTPSPLAITGAVGVNSGEALSVSFSHQTASNFTFKGILQSASNEVAVGDFQRGSLTFVVDSSI